MCGGLGNRLRSIISDKPKVLVKIGNKIFLDIVIKNLSQYGFRDIILCTGYLKEKILDHINGQSEYDNIRFSDEKILLGTGGALRNAKSLITSNNFLVVNGDSICMVNIKDFFEFHISKESLLSIVLSKSSIDQSKDYGYVTLDDFKRIKGFNEKSNSIQNNEKLLNAGIYFMNKGIFSHMPRQEKFSLEYDLFPEVIRKNNCYGFITDNEIIDIGTPERFKRAQDIFKPRGIND